MTDDSAMILETKLKAVRRKIVGVGVWGTLRLILDHTIGRILHREYLLFYANLSAHSLDAASLNRDVVGKEVRAFEDMASKEIESLREYAGEAYIQEARTRLEKSWILFLACLDGEVAGGGWVIDCHSELKAKVVPLVEGDIVLLDYFTYPAYRGKNVYPSLLASILTRFRERNAVRAFISAHERNVASIRGIEKVGFRHCLNYEVWSRGMNEFVMWKRVVKEAPKG